MEIVYLKNGTKAHLVAKSDKGYVVDPVNVYTDTSGEYEDYEEPSGSLEIVDKVYSSPPRELLDEECKTKTEELNRISQECVAKKAELEKLKQQTLATQRLIFNKEELLKAKRLIVWVKDRVAPYIMDVKNNLKLTLSYTISQWGGIEEKCWAYSSWSDVENQFSSYSEYYDEKYGIKADLTDDEILEITLERQRGREFDGWRLGQADDKWLTTENIEKKKQYKLLSDRNELAKAEKELENAQKRIEKLKTQLAVS